MVLIFRDCDGLPDRLDTLRETFPGEVLAVCPHHAPQPGARTVRVPDAWLPRLDMPRRWLEWFAADALPLVASHELAADVDFVWWVESDVWAPADVWRRVFAATTAADADLIAPKVIHRGHGFAGRVGGFRWAGNPEWAALSCSPAVCRLSRRSLGWLLAAAEPLRDCYSEIRLPSVVARHGGDVRDLAGFCSYSAPRAFSGSLASHRFVAGVMNHPVKNHIGKSGVR